MEKTCNARWRALVALSHIVTELRREDAMRARFYPQWVESVKNKLTADAARYQRGVLQAGAEVITICDEVPEIKALVNAERQARAEAKTAAAAELDARAADADAAMGV